MSGNVYKSRKDEYSSWSNDEGNDDKESPSWSESEYCIRTYGNKGYRPPILSHFNFLTGSRSGNLVLGASSLNGRFWNGEICYYKNALDAITPLNHTSKFHFNSGVSDGEFLNDDTVLIGDDAGYIGVYKITYEESEIENKWLILELTQALEHDDSVVSVSVADGGTKAVSAALNRSIKVWDIESLRSEITYNTAHFDLVTDVVFAPGNDLFISSSFDGYVLLWDTRKSKPAQVLLKHPTVCFTALDWFNDSADKALVGGDNGSVTLFDIRQLNGILSATEYFSRPVHKITAHRGQKFVSACGDTNAIKVIDYKGESPILKYYNGEHKDYVRDTLWMMEDTNLVLLSCGWDGQVIKHDVK